MNFSPRHDWSFSFLYCLEPFFDILASDFSLCSQHAFLCRPIVSLSVSSCPFLLVHFSACICMWHVCSHVLGVYMCGGQGLTLRVSLASVASLNGPMISCLLSACWHFRQTVAFYPCARDLTSVILHMRKWFTQLCFRLP